MDATLDKKDEPIPRRLLLTTLSLPIEPFATGLEAAVAVAVPLLGDNSDTKVMLRLLFPPPKERITSERLYEDTNSFVSSSGDIRGRNIDPSANLSLILCHSLLTFRNK